MSVKNISSSFRLGSRNEEINKGLTFVYVSLGGKKTVNTKIKIRPKNWNSIKQQVNNTHPRYFEYNKHLKTIEITVIDYNYNSSKYNIPTDIDWLKKIIRNDVNIEFENIINKRLTNYIGNSYSTTEIAFKILLESSINLCIEGLNNNLIDNYDNHMIIHYGYKRSTRIKHFNIINPFLDELVHKKMLFPNHSGRYRPLEIPNKS